MQVCPAPRPIFFFLQHPAQMSEKEGRTETSRPGLLLLPPKSFLVVTAGVRAPLGCPQDAQHFLSQGLPAVRNCLGLQWIVPVVTIYLQTTASVKAGPLSYLFWLKTNY